MNGFWTGRARVQVRVRTGLLAVLAVALARLTRLPASGAADRLMLHGPVALYAGWVSVATVVGAATTGTFLGAPGDLTLLGALVLLDACVRLLPGVMGAASSGVEESFESGLLEYPHYTRPLTWEGRTIPEVLRSGDHAKIAAWRRAMAETDTRLRRPDLWERHTGARVQSASGAQRESKDRRP